MAVAPTSAFSLRPFWWTFPFSSCPCAGAASPEAVTAPAVSPPHRRSHPGKSPNRRKELGFIRAPDSRARFLTLQSCYSALRQRGSTPALVTVCYASRIQYGSRKRRVSLGIRRVGGCWAADSKENVG